MGLLDRVLGKPEAELETPQDQSSADRELVSFVKNRVEEARNHAARISQEGIWMTNIAYLMGYDGIYYDPVTRQFRPTSNKTPLLKRNRIFINKILPSVQNRLARLCKNPPRFDVRPNGPDSDEKELARFKVQIADMMWDQLKLNIKRIPLYMNVMQCGHAYVKVSYDPELGGLILDPESGEMIYEGDIRNDVISAFEVFPDPLAKEFDDLTWLCHAKIRKLDYFRSHYPERGNLVKEEGAWLLSTQYEARINSLNSVNGAQAPISTQTKNTAIELAYYEKRSKHHPQGRLIIVANGVKLQDGPLPAGEIPFAKFDDVVIGGKYNSESIITHLRPLQDRKNRLISQKDSFIQKMLAGKYIAAKGHGLTKEALNDQSGEVVEFTPVPNAAPPQAMTPPQMPNYVYQEEQAIDTNFDDIIGINEVSKGQLPAAGIPAIGMQLLTEQDDTRIGIVAENLEHAWARVMKLNLLYAQRFYKTPRLLKLSGKNQEYTVKQFTGEELTGDHDIIVIRGSTLPGSKTLRRQEIINAWQQGLLGDPQDPKVRENVLGMLEFGDVAEVWEDYALDQAQCKRVLETILAGGVPEIAEYDNHPMIFLHLNRFRKSEKFLSIPPEQQEMVVQTMEESVNHVMKMDQPVQPPLPGEPGAEAVPMPPPPMEGEPPIPGGPQPQLEPLPPLPPGGA